MITLRKAEQILYVLERATHFASSRAFDRCPQAIQTMRHLVAALAAEERDRKNPIRAGSITVAICDKIEAERRYPPLTPEEVAALSAMAAGAPWVSKSLVELVAIIALYDRLRAEGKRPVDPADAGVVEVPRAELRRLVNCSDLEMKDGDLARTLAEKWLGEQK